MDHGLYPSLNRQGEEMISSNVDQQKIVHLEREIQRLKIGTCSMIVIVFFFCFSGLSEKTENAVVANRFVLTDENGAPRAELGVDTSRSHLPFFAMYDEKGEMRISMMILDDQSVALAFLDRAGNAGIGLGLDKTGLPNLSLMDQKGNIRCKLGVNEKAETRFSLMNGPRTRTVNMMVSDQGHGELDIAGAQDNSLARLQVTNSEIPGLFVSDGKELRAALGILPTKEVSLILMNQDGKITFQAPQ